MKVKVKLDLDSIKQWMLEHGEKAALGLMAVVFLLFIYATLKHESLDSSKQPDRLQAKAEEVRRFVSESKWDAKREGVQVVDFQKRVARQTIDLAAFPQHTPFTTPLFPPKSNRDIPNIFNVEELRAAAGFGTFAFTEKIRNAKAGQNQAPAGRGQGAKQSAKGYKPSGTAILKAQPWAVITGLVPQEKQEQEFARAFERAQGADPKRDILNYLAPQMERAEIDSANPDKLDWKPLSLDQIRKLEDEWEASVTEIVGSAYVDPQLTAPLGPLVYVGWGEAVAHPKLVSESGDARKTQAEKNAPQGPNGGNGGDVPPGQPNPPANAAAKDVVKYRLFRVFDYTVEPNKKYRYRVKLAAANPNYKVSAQFLNKPEAAEANTIQSDDWTQPSGLVAIPNGFDVFAGGPEPSRGGEPAAKLMLTAIDPQEGIEVTTEISVQRGTMANIREKEVIAIDPRNDQAKVMTNVDFKSDMVVLDIYGGKALSKKKEWKDVTAPIEMLLFDARGNLTVHNELDDQGPYQSRKEALAASEAQSGKRKETDLLSEDPKKPPKKTRPRP